MSDDRPKLVVVDERQLTVEPPPLLRRVLCFLRCCPFVVRCDDTGCWGECPLCGRRSGFVARTELRSYIEREARK